MKHALRLLWLLSRVHLRTSDYRSVLGIFWSFVGPLLTFLVLFLIFQDRFGRQIPMFTLKLLTGIIAVSFFTQCVHVCLQAVRNSRNLLMYSLVPSAAVIFSPLAAALCRALAGLGLCLGIAALHGLLDVRQIPLMLCYFLLLGLFAAGFGLILGTLNVLAADVGEIWQVLSPLLIFVTPVFYSMDMLSSWAALLVSYFNPVSATVLILQSAISGHRVPGITAWVYVYPVFSAVFFMTGGWLFYKKFEKHLLEV